MFDFSGMTWVEIMGQFLGFFGMGCTIMSFQARRKKYILLMQTIACLFWISHYFFIGSVIGAGMEFVSMIRNLLYIRKAKISPKVFWLVPTVSLIAFAVITGVTYQSPVDILPFFACLAATVALYMKKENVLRVLSLATSVFWFTYNIFAFSIAGMLNEIFASASIIIALIRYAKPKRNLDTRN